jgi:bifunctional enzyme CysN/CysC
MALAADQKLDDELRAYRDKDLLRFITCGSVDDGKSTLIGRLLYDSKMVFEDQISTLEKDSKAVGTQGGALDFALLMDGLTAEREQGITIDVSYRHFATTKRAFIVADTPGHEQYTRNMITGASTASAAVILVDARKGILTQTRRHAFLVSLMGIRQVVLAINKMDLVGYDQAAFRRIHAEFAAFGGLIGLDAVAAIPLSALRGDNVTARSTATAWYDGPTLIEQLEAVEVIDQPRNAPFRLCVQWVNRPDLNFRGFAGTVASGEIRPGDTVRVLPSGKEARVARIATYDGDLTHAAAGQSVTLTLDHEIDVARGDVLASPAEPPAIADQFNTTLIWMSEEPLLPGRPYLVKIGTKTVTGTITSIRHKINVNTLEQLAAKTLALNEIAVVNMQLAQGIPFDPYEQNRETGGFIVIDRITNATVGAGLIRFALRRSENIHWQAVEVDKTARASLKHQKACVLWFTGLSGAGKSTIANALEKKLFALGRHTYLLDGDNVRHGLNRDLGFTDADRVENIRRIAEVSKLMVDAGLIVLVSFISPFRAEREFARNLLQPGEFFEIFVDTPLGEAEKRDPKGLYKKARRGEIRNFTGISSPYEAPENPDLRIDTRRTSAEAAAELILRLLNERGMLSTES